MVRKVVDAVMGREPFDTVIRNVQIVQVCSGEIIPGDIGIASGKVAFVGNLEEDCQAGEVIEGNGRYAVPGFLDSHMHLESSMMTPAHFAEAVLPKGTTAVAADPHEIGNVMGAEGVSLLCEMTRDLPLHVYMMAPSTIPSAPGFENSGADIRAEEVRRMLRFPGVIGLGEVMDFNGVADGDPRMMEIVQAALESGLLLDGHVPAFKGRRLQAFAASGIDCDHTYMDPEIAAEKLRYGMCVQIQERFLTSELMAYLERCPVQNRIMLVTDDVPLSRLASEGHLDSVVRKAIRLGLSPMKAIRYVTLNAADRLRLPRRGAIAPGRYADILLLDSLEEIRVSAVFSDGILVAKDGRMVRPLVSKPFPRSAYRTMKLAPLSEEDFKVRAKGSRVLVNVIEQDGKTSRTELRQVWFPLRDGCLAMPEGIAKMAVFNRYGRTDGRQIGFLSNMGGFRGALATTYAHDCHNLIVYGSNEADMCKAANLLIECGGGVAAVRDGEVLSRIPLPIAGLLCEDPMPLLAEKFEGFVKAAKEMGLNHGEVLTFITLMALAVSPKVKLTDAGLVDAVNKKFLPLIVRTIE
ncbi:MAG: adenine deaminase [Lachnospiraceae bacterium]|nr:adenine deaminase [Lachnospiraceae bacterium]